MTEARALSKNTLWLWQDNFFFLCLFKECLGALKISMTSSGEENLTEFFTKQLHDLENKRNQYMLARGRMKEEFKQFSPTKVRDF